MKRVLLACVLALLVCRPASAANFAFDTKVDSPGQFSSTSPYTWTHNTTGDEVLVVVLAGTGIPNLTGTSVTYNSVTMTRLGPNTASAHVVANSYDAWIIKLGANAGNNSVSVTWSGGGYIAASSISYTGSAAATPYEGLAQNAEQVANGTSFTETMTTSTNNALPILVCANSNSNPTTFSTGTNATLRATASGFTVAEFDYGAVLGTAGTATYTPHDSGVEYINAIVFALKPSGGGSSPVVNCIIGGGVCH